MPAIWTVFTFARWIRRITEGANASAQWFGLEYQRGKAPQYRHKAEATYRIVTSQGDRKKQARQQDNEQ